MLVLRHRLAIAGVAALAAIAVPVAALASAPSAPPAKPAPPAAAPSASKPGAVPPGKQVPPGNPVPPADAAAAASKEAASKEAAAAQQGVPAPIRAFAAQLGVSITAAGPAFKEVAGLAGQDGGVDAGSQAFAAIASELGVSPARLAAAWAAVSQDMPGK
jgi:hypothetical protein